jgi:hypothetical protein
MQRSNYCQHNLKYFEKDLIIYYLKRGRSHELCAIVPVLKATKLLHPPREKVKFFKLNWALNETSRKKQENTAKLSSQ